MTIQKRKCICIFHELLNKHTETRNGYHYMFTSGAREIEKELHEQWAKSEITSNEKTYIFGLVCDWALSHGGEDFFRI